MGHYPENSATTGRVTYLGRITLTVVQPEHQLKTAVPAGESPIRAAGGVRFRVRVPLLEQASGVDRYTAIETTVGSPRRLAMIPG